MKVPKKSQMKIDKMREMIKIDDHKKRSMKNHHINFCKSRRLHHNA